MQMASVEPSDGYRDDRTNGPTASEIFDDTPRGREKRALLRRLEQLEWLFDRNFSLFGVRFGYDALLGLVPVLGDTVAAAVAVYIFWKARRLGLPGHLQSKMATNIAFDYVLGSIPVLGTIVDVAFKANTRNIRLLKEHLAERNEHPYRA
jgi:hypothetical protein